MTNDQRSSFVIRRSSICWIYPMNDFKYAWLFGLVATAVIIILPTALFITRDDPPPDDPWFYAPTVVPGLNHSDLVNGPFETGADVTRDCLTCHETAAAEIMQTTHWTWETKPILLEGRDEPVTVGKKNQLNNFCIGIAGNWNKCTTCHAGYGWEDNNFDFTDETKVDCLVCHAEAGYYGKGDFGYPAEGVDLFAAAQSVGRPTRQNCGSCHFDGGGGDAVKHGDLDGTLAFPTEAIDVHMGRHNFQCVDCHQTHQHRVPGQITSVSPIAQGPYLGCDSCHNNGPHQDERINLHLEAVACQTCHIPEGAVRTASKMEWDWSTAGQEDRPEDIHTFLKIKGDFVYEQGFTPAYAWFNGEGGRYILGDTIDPTETTLINWPLGNIRDPQAKIWPFKLHNALQPYDAVYNYLLIPMTAGEDGYWTNFDWQNAFYSNQENSGLAYSGQYGFAPTRMYWSMTHMVATKERALQCVACHGENGRLDWQALGYPGDPLYWGGRQ
jgi:octaheme c-type cytochrome (tetrathionate reductase family)